MEFKYYLWHRNDPENGKTVPSWTEISESQVPSPPDSRIFAIIRVYVGGEEFTPPPQVSYLNWDGTWIPMSEAPSVII